MLELVIGNKNYSSWSMRPWVLLRHFGIPFEERMLRFGDDFHAPDSPFHARLSRISPAGRVPVLVDDGFAVWDTLAIAEYVAERFPQHPVWPRDARQRARARSVCAEMHSGFGALRTHWPMNIELEMPEIGPRVLREHPQVGRDLARVTGLWTEALRESGGPFLFGEFGAVDAFYAPVVARLRSYGVAPDGEAGAYAARVWADPAVAAWAADARAEHEFVQADEPYRQAPAAQAG